MKRGICILILILISDKSKGLEIEDDRIQKNCPLYKPCVEKCMKVKERYIMPESMTGSSILGRDRRFFTEMIRQCEEECSYVKYCD
jgi:hypothetical protein